MRGDRTLIYTLICTALTGLLSLTGIYRNKRKPQSKSKRVNKIFAAASAAVFIPYMVTAIMACVHGADPETLQRFGILRTVQAIQNSPIADRNGNLDQQGNILIYYRFGCGDCEAVYDSLKAATAGKEDIYWVASRQSVGRELLQKYAVPEVPAGVVILGDGMYVSHVLGNSVYDQLNGTEDIQMDTYALDRLLELQEREK